MSRCRRCQRCRLSVEGVSRECRLTLVSRCRGCRGSVDGDLDIRDALMLSRCQRCQGGGWAHGQSKLIGVQSVPTAQGMSPYHNTSPQYTLEPQRRGLSTFPAWLTLLTPVDNIRASRMSTLVDTSVGGVEVVSRWCRLTPVSTVSTVSRECRDSVESVEPGLKMTGGLGSSVVEVPCLNVGVCEADGLVCGVRECWLRRAILCGGFCCLCCLCNKLARHWFLPNAPLHRHRDF